MKRATPSDNFRKSRFSFRHNGKEYFGNLVSQVDGWHLIFKVEIDGYKPRWMWMDSNGYYRFRFLNEWIDYWQMK